MFNFEKKCQLVRSGKSAIFNNWKSVVADLTEDEFISALEWLCSDPLNNNKLTREIGLTRNGVVKLNRIIDKRSGLTVFRHLDGNLWYGDVFTVPCSNPDFADSNGMYSTNYKISISARDKI